MVDFSTNFRDLGCVDIYKNIVGRSERVACIRSGTNNSMNPVEPYYIIRFENSFDIYAEDHKGIKFESLDQALALVSKLMVLDNVKYA